MTLYINDLQIVWWNWEHQNKNNVGKWKVFFSNDYFRISVLWVGILTLPGFPTADADDCLTLISIIVAVAQYKDCIVDTRVDSADNMLL